MITAINPTAAFLKQTKPVQQNLAVLFTVLFLLCAFGGTVSTLMSVYLPVVVSDVLGKKTPAEVNNISAYINAVFIAGWAAGGFTWGIFSDKIGRKKTLILAAVCFGVATIATGNVLQWQAIIACRLLSGFGVGGVLVASYTLINETWPVKNKSIFTGILSIAFPAGIFSAGLINYAVAGWRQGFYTGTIPVVLAIACIWLINESQVWKLYKNQPAKSNHLAQLFGGSYSRNLWTGAVIFGTMLIGLWAIFSWVPSWVQSLITTGDAQKQRGLSMMLLGMGGLTGGFISGWFANAVGLRNALLTCFAACAGLSFILFKTNTFFTPVIYAEVGVLALFFGGAQGILAAFIPQLFPTGLRSTAIGFCFNIGRVFTSIAVLFVGLLVNTAGSFGNILLIFSSVFFIGLLAVIFFKPSIAVT
jgi:predicted MFS family arabinose efflux permease